MLLKQRLQDALGFLPVVVNVAPEAQAQVFTKFQLLALPGVGCLVTAYPVIHVLLAGAQDDSLDAPLRHEVQRPVRAADDGLPGLHRQVGWSRHQGKLFQLVTPIGNLRREGVVFALVAESILVEGLHYDFKLLFKSSRLASPSIMGAPKVSTSRVW